jgi:hypothetical protein
MLYRSIHPGHVGLPFYLACGVLLLLGCLASAGRSQTRLDRIGSASVSAADQAMLSSSNRLRGLGCTVKPVSPSPAIDLKFHTGYVVEIPLRNLAGDGRELRATLRVTPLDRPGRAAFFSSVVTAPPIAPETGGSVDLYGEYAIGPGRYRVDWLMRDQDGVCTSHWDLKAKLDGSLQQAPFAIAPDTAEALPRDPFEGAGELAHRHDRPLYVKVLVNFSPSRRDMLTPQDVRAIAGILRGVALAPPFGRFSVVAFSMDEQRVVYRQPGAPTIDFPALGRAVHKLHSGTVDLRQMEDPKRSTRFLTSLLSAELADRGAAPDAVIVISPNVPLDDDISRDKLRSSVHVECPVFYLNYNPHPWSNPWRGGIGNALKAYHSLEYTISAPGDLGSALKRMMARLEEGP